MMNAEQEKKSSYIKIRYTAKSIKHIHAVDVILEAGASAASAFPHFEREKDSHSSR
jgi:hypothetical protein